MSAGALYRSGAATLNKRSSGGHEMFYGTQRHHKDMFTGDLGIPDIQSHVGSVVHTFETMAMMRQLAEQEKRRRNSHYLTTPSKYDRQMSPEHHNTNSRKYNKLKQKSTTSSRSKQKLTLSKRLSLSSKNYSFIPKLSQSHKKTDTKHTDQSVYTVHHKPMPYTPTVTAILKNSTNFNLDDDYRRNLYKQQLLPATTMNRLRHKTYTTTPTTIDGDNDEENIINKAFNEIFINYGETGEENDQEEEVGVNDEKLIYHHNERGGGTDDFGKENKLFKIPPNSSQLEATVDPSLVRHHHHHYHLHHPTRNNNEVKRTTAAKF